jgi:hypothetical protein
MWQHGRTNQQDFQLAHNRNSSSPELPHHLAIAERTRMRAIAIVLMSAAAGNFWIGLALGFALGWRLKPRPSPPAHSFIECPACHEPIRAGSTVCSHCHTKVAIT